MKSNTDRTAPFPLGTAPCPQIKATVSAVKFDHRSLGSPKRKNLSIKNLGECSNRFIRFLAAPPPAQIPTYK